jgi:hypothetical protein
MPLPENLSIGKVFNRYGNDFESEKEIRDLSIQQRKRNLMIVGFVVFGGIAGYMLAKKLNLKTWASVATTVLGGAVFGTSVSMLTQAKYNSRNQAIDEKRQVLEQARYLTEIAQRGANKTEEKIKSEIPK